MDFWNSILTEKSWNLLKELNKKPFKFILIGGWAAYLWTKQHKSKDVDIVLLDFKDMEFLKKEYDLRKNDSLKRYEIKFEEIDVDVYVPYYSKLGVSIEEIKKNSTKIEGISVVNPEILLILKQTAELSRENSVKGRKDRIDIMTLLLFSEMDLKKYKELLKKFRLDNFLMRLKSIINSFDEIKYLGLNPREFKVRKKELLEKLK